MDSQEISASSGGQTFHGEFDSGSERTLAAWIRHASRTLIRKGESGARVRNTWVICREDWNNSSKDELILDSLFGVKIYRFGKSLRDIS